MNICVQCGREFVPKPKTAGKFCGQACYQAHPKKHIPFSERFWALVEKGPGCWNWKGCDDGQQGYGRIKYEQRNIGAHRASWLLHFGEIPDGLHVCHGCDNPKCVRPEHLFLGTNEENRADCVAKGRQKCGDNRGSRHGMSKVTEVDVKAIRAAYIPQKHGNKAKIAAQFGISESAVVQIIWRKRWQHLE
jgi:hypothetical protein